MGKDDKANGRLLGDLMGDPEFLAAQKAKLDAACEIATQPEATRALDHTTALRGLAKLAGVDPGTVVAAYEKNGGPLARVLDALLNLEQRAQGRRGPKKKHRDAERQCVVEILEGAGLEGVHLDAAILEVAAGEVSATSFGKGKVTVGTYRRSAVRYKGDKLAVGPLAALYYDSEPIRMAWEYVAARK